MTILNNALDFIKFKKDFSYAKAAPTLVSNTAGISSEIARWVLDRNAILYKNELHAPWIIQKKIKRIIGNEEEGNSPVLEMTDALIYSADSIVRFWEQRCTPENRLLPTDPTERDAVLDLHHLFTGEFFQSKVTKYMLANMLASKKSAIAVFTEGVSNGEKVRYKLGFPIFKARLTKEFELSTNSADDNLNQIKKVFDQVTELLSDNRKFLVGDQFTLADLSFAAAAAPMILPVEFGGSLPEINEISDSYRAAVIALRETSAGQFVFRMYLENRPVMLSQSLIPAEPSSVAKLITRMMISMKKKQYKLFYFVQKRFPVLNVPFVKLVVVSKNDLLVETLERDLDFTIEEINNKKMSEQKGAFFLGWDRNNPQFNRERDFVRKATKREDLDIIRKFVRESAEDVLKHAQSYGKIDVSSSLAKVVIVRLIDYYFGVSAPNETVMKHWLRIMFFDLFLNFKNDAKKHEEALKAGNDRAVFLFQVIKDRRQDLKDGKTLPDNLFNRMILMAQEPGNEWADDDVLQRNIGGLLTGILEGTNKSILLILDELFNQPEALKKAIEVAHGDDMNKMYGYISEALRFNPTQPGVIRYSEQQQTINGKGSKTYTIKAKRKVLALTAGAMFDPAAFPDPKQFDGERKNVTYMNYGFGLHECYGKYINAVTLTEIVAATLRQKNIRRESGRIGRGTGLSTDLLPTNFVVKFN